MVRNNAVQYDKLNTDTRPLAAHCRLWQPSHDFFFYAQRAALIYFFLILFFFAAPLYGAARSACGAHSRVRNFFFSRGCAASHASHALRDAGPVRSDCPWKTLNCWPVHDQFHARGSPRGGVLRIQILGAATFYRNGVFFLFSFLFFVLKT